MEHLSRSKMSSLSFVKIELKFQIFEKKTAENYACRLKRFDLSSH